MTLILKYMNLLMKLSEGYQRKPDNTIACIDDIEEERERENMKFKIKNQSNGEKIVKLYLEDGVDGEKVLCGETNTGITSDIMNFYGGRGYRISMTNEFIKDSGLKVDSKNQLVVWSEFDRSEKKDIHGINPCPCGITPEYLLITEGKEVLYSYVSGNCCNSWYVMFRTKLPGTDAECMTLATEAWNNTVRKVEPIGQKK